MDSMSVSDLIKTTGGVDEISSASQRTKYPVSSDAVHKWRKNGIPDVHWPIFIRAGVSVEVLFKANELLRRKKFRHEDGEPQTKRRPSTRVAA